MCGRYRITTPRINLEKLHFAQAEADYEPREQVFPTQTAPVLRQEAGEEHLRLCAMQWGLIPFYDKAIKPRGLINARSETVHEKSAFKDAFKKRRCIVPADGFYEWDRGSKDRHYYAPQQGMFAFAGLWQPYLQGDGQTRDTFTILTTIANELVAPVHDRMPVVLNSNAIGAWLSADVGTDMLRELLVPLPVSDMTDTNQGKASGTPKENTDAALAQGSLFG